MREMKHLLYHAPHVQVFVDTFSSKIRSINKEFPQHSVASPECTFLWNYGSCQQCVHSKVAEFTE